MSRDRDRTLEQALTHELRAAGTPNRDTCVDAETLGAWADGGLHGAQLASVELHVSTCARCQAIVGQLPSNQSMPCGVRVVPCVFHISASQHRREAVGWLGLSRNGEPILTHRIA